MRAKDFVLEKNKSLSLEKIAEHYGVDFQVIFRVKNGFFSRKFCRNVYNKDGISLDGYHKDEKVKTLRFYCEDSVYNEFIETCNNISGRVCTQSIKNILDKAKR